ncbi:M15 family metallopeptidase [Xanthobacter wiegelii]|uniref:M15 family metallopeptidase n=1 Tax=Xanthobacter wiegelii TaxID=3119913 RepID=UPI00372C1514
MSFVLSERSEKNLAHVHPDLVRIVRRAAEISSAPFEVVDGARTVEEQRVNIRNGVSKTMNSRHIIAANGYAHAVDIALRAKTDVAMFSPAVAREKIAPVMKQAARELRVPIEWGGDWKGSWDTPHWQLPWKAYPARATVAEVAESPPVTGSTGARSAIVKAGAVGAPGGGLTYDSFTALMSQVDDAHQRISMGTVFGLMAGLALLAVAGWIACDQWDAAGRPMPRMPWQKRRTKPASDGEGD